MITSVLNTAAALIVCVFDTFSVLFFRPNKPPGGGRLLLTRLDNIGDFVLWSRCAANFRRLYPDYRITLIVKETVVPLAKIFPYWDEVWGVDFKKFRRNPFYRFATLRKVALAGFEVAIQPTYSRHFMGDSLIRASKAAQRIGSVGNFDQIAPVPKKISDRWYTRLLPADESLMLESKRHEEFIRNLGDTEFQPQVAEFPPLADFKSELQFNEPYFVLFPGASWEGRQWPIERFAEVAGEVRQRTNWLGVICGGPGEESLCHALEDSTSGRLVNLAGKTTLLELIEVIRRAEVLIGNETSAIHIAAATRTKSLCLLGGGHFGRFLPYDMGADSRLVCPVPVFFKMDCFGCNWQCIYPREARQPVQCIRNIEPGQVTTALQDFLTASM